MQLVIVTNNQHKIDEMNAILSLDMPIVSYKDVFKKEVHIVEDGVTFEENY